MLLFEAFIYNIIAVIIPCRKLNELRDHATSGGSGGKVLIWNGFCAINILSSIISTLYAIRLGHGTSADRDGIIMGSTILSSLALVLFDFDGDIDNKDSTSYYGALLFVGLVVLSGFVFASLSTHAAFTSCSASNNVTASSTTTNTAIDIYPVCSFLRKHHLTFFFWTTVYASPLVLVDIATITIIYMFPQIHIEIESVRKSIIIFHGIVIFQCFLSKQYHKINAGSISNNKHLVNHGTSSENMTRNVTTIGEWYLLSTIMSFLFADFCLWIASQSSSSSLPRPSHLVVSQSGILGCILGTIVATTISRSNAGICLRRRSRSIPILLHMLVIIIFTFLCIELALRQQLNFHKKHLEPSLSSSNTFYNPLNTSNIIIQKLVWKTQSMQNLPLHIKWIITFLSTSDDVEVLPFMLRSTSAAYDNLSSCPLQPTIMNNSGVAIMRGWWLIYWAFVLFLTLPAAILLARYLLLLKQTHKIHNLVSTGRKLFHFIAILLFGPVTGYAPSLMTLSYAVALVLLVLLESLRYELSVSTSRNPDSNRSLTDTTMSNTGKTTTTTATHVSATLKRYSKTIKGRQISLGMNEFYYAFLDEKDCEEGSPLVITHIALILGCAIPQWIAAGITAYNGSINKDGNILLVLLPYCGILILGIGDSFGAIVGSSKFGRTRWPGSKRTLEGSASMLFSMLLFVSVFHYFSNMHQEQPKHIILGVLSLSIVTLLEASTMQIDNICLPLAGATVLLIFGKN